MDPSPTPSGEPWDVEKFRLPAGAFGEPAPSKRPPRHRPGEPFIKGPIPYAWMAAACRLPGSGLHVASAYWYLCRRYPGPNRIGLDALARDLGISDDTASRALHAAEEAGLLMVEREPGCKLTVSVLDLPRLPSETDRRPLRGPIPWGWWHAAMRLDKPALRTAAACWMVADWGGVAEFELALGEWADLGLSRYAASRGLDGLERARLVEVANRMGRSPIVTLLGESSR